MAAPAALAIKFDLATRRLNAAMDQLARDRGVPVPPPVVKADTPEARRAFEAERMASFLESIVNSPTEKRNEQHV